MITLRQVEYYRHELLDRTANLVDTIEAQLEKHEGLEAHREAFTPKQLARIEKHIEAASKALSKLYQYIGEIHL
jgi:hypothetical protein